MCMSELAFLFALSLRSQVYPSSLHIACKFTLHLVLT